MHYSCLFPLTLILLCVACSGSAQKPDDAPTTQTDSALAPSTAPDQPATPAAKPASSAWSFTGINEELGEGFQVATVWAVQHQEGSKFYIFGRGVTKKGTFTMEFDQAAPPEYMRSVSGTRQVALGFIVAWHKDLKLPIKENGEIELPLVAYAHGQAIDYGLMFFEDRGDDPRQPQGGFKLGKVACAKTTTGPGATGPAQPVPCEEVKLSDINKIGFKKPAFF